MINIATVIFLVLVSGYLFATKRDILETWESVIRMLAATLICLCWIFVNMLLAHSLVFENIFPMLGRLRIYDAFVPLLLLGIFVYPLASTIHTYLRLPAIFFRRYGLSLLREDSDRYLELVSGLSKKIGLKHVPRLLTSSKENVSPFVFGRSNVSTFLVLPENFEKLLDIADNNIGNERATGKEALKEFILLHELSHIKHRDVPFMSFLTVLLLHLRRWLFLVACLLLMNIVGLNMGFESRVPSLVYVVLLPMIIILFGLYISACRQRELLADKRSALYLPTNKLELILRQNARVGRKNLSTFELFLVLMSSLHHTVSAREQKIVRLLRWLTRSFTKIPSGLAISSVFLGEGRPKLWKSFDKLFRQTHPAPKVRVESLKSKSGYSIRTQVPSHEAIGFSGLSVGCLLVAYVLVALHMRAQEVFVRSFVDVMLLLGLIPGIIMTLPMRASVLRRRVSFKYLSLFFRRTLAFILVESATTVVFITGIAFVFALNKGEALLPYALSTIANFAPHLIRFNLFTVTLSFVMAAVLTFRLEETFTTLRRRDLTDLITIFGSAIFSLLVFIVISINLFTPFPNIPTFGFLFVVTGVFLVEVLVKALSAFSEGENYTQVVIKGHIYRFEFYGHAVKRLLGMLTPPAIMFVFMTVLGGSTLLLARLTGIAGYTGESSLLLFCVATLIIILVMIFLSRAHEKLDAYHVAQYLEYYEGISWPENKGRAPLLARNKLAHAWWRIKENRTLDFNALHMSNAFRIGSIFRLTTPPDKLISDMVKWVLSCQDNSGGFGPWPGGLPEFYSTCHALEILSYFHSIEDCRIEEHTHFILSYQRGDGGFLEYYSRSNLSDTLYALKALEKLRALGSLRRTDCIAWLLSHLGDPQLTPREMCQALECLAILNGLDDEIISEIERTWWLPRFSQFRSMNFDTNIQLAYYYLKIASFLFARRREKQIDNIGQRIADYGDALEKRIQKEIRKFSGNTRFVA